MGLVQGHPLFDGSLWIGEGCCMCDPYSSHVESTMRYTKVGDIYMLICTLVLNNNHDRSVVTIRSIDEQISSDEIRWKEQNYTYGNIRGKFSFTEKKVFSTWKSKNYRGSETFTKISDEEYQVNGISQEADEKRSSWNITLMKPVGSSSFPSNQ